MSLQETDRAAAMVAKAPRVSLADIEAAIAERHHVIAADALGLPVEIDAAGYRVNPLGLLSLCILVMRNGFVVVGKSAPASPENFNEDLGRKFAYEDAVRQLWPLMGFALRHHLAAQASQIAR